MHSNNNERNKQDDYSNEDYQEIKNYLLLLRTNIADQKEIAEKFFNSDINHNIIQHTLKLIIENANEKDDIRLQATVMLKRLYNEGNKYIKYNKQIDEEENELNYNNSFNTSTGLHTLLALPLGYSTDKVSKNLEIYDSLPYIDGHYLQEIRIAEETKKLIQEQMTAMKRENPGIEEFYLSKLNRDDGHLKFNKDSMHHDLLLKKELERVEKGKKIDVFKNKIQTVFDNPPPSKFHDESTWRNLIEEVNYSLQQINVKNFNLDLLIKYGPNMWKRYLKGLECLLNQLENEKKSLENKVEEINRQRKFLQVKYFIN